MNLFTEGQRVSFYDFEGEVFFALVVKVHATEAGPRYTFRWEDDGTETVPITAEDFEPAE